MKERQDIDSKYLKTCFDRQIRIDLWNQDKLKQQTILVLGVGGLGSTVIMNVLRLGVKRVIMVDYDVVDNHNLNRQILFGIDDVGKKKIDAALKNSILHNVGGAVVEGHCFDAVKEWGRVVKLARQCTFVYNCIDYGDKYDIAVASMCRALKLPLVMGGTFATMFTVDFINPDGQPCFICLNDEYKYSAQTKELVERVSPEKILDLQNIDFLPRNDNPIGRSSSLVCIICGQLMVSHLVNYLFLSEDPVYKSSRLIGYHNTFEIVKFDVDPVKSCIFCGDPNYVEPVPEPVPEPVQVLTETKEKDQKDNLNSTEEIPKIQQKPQIAELDEVKDIQQKLNEVSIDNQEKS